jgi:hypothetical protein
MAKTLTVREFASLTKGLPPLLEAACIRGLRSAALRGVVEQIDKAEPYPAVDTGMLRQSALAEPIPEGAELSVNAPQAAWMEFGTRPHMPPLGPILTWARRKFGLGADDKKGSLKKGASGPRRTKMQRIAQNERAAYNIARSVQLKIYRHGTAPRGFFSKAMTTIVSDFAPKEVRHELKALEKRL